MTSLRTLTLSLVAVLAAVGCAATTDDNDATSSSELRGRTDGREASDPGAGDDALRCGISGLRGRCLSEEDWNRAAVAHCAGKPARVGRFAVGESCGRGVYSSAEFTCCVDPGAGADPARDPQRDPTVDTRDPQRDPPAPLCRVGEIGSRTCERAEALEQHASRLCGAAGYAVTRFAAGDPCREGGYTSAKFECCTR